MTLKGDFPDPEEVAALAMMALAAVALAGGLVIDAFWRLPRLRGHRRVHSHDGKPAYVIIFSRLRHHLCALPQGQAFYVPSLLYPEAEPEAVGAMCPQHSKFI
jgi:hypothetical protein